MKTLHILYLLTFIALTCPATEIRVRNDSKVHFTNVVAGEKKYGDIQQGASTGYQTWKNAYRYAFVSLLADSKLLRVQPEDYVGETPLGDGRFTYVLTIQDGRLDIRAEKDPPDNSLLYSADASVEEQWFPHVDGIFTKGEFIDLNTNATERLYIRYGPIRDSGVELERTANNVVVWRVHVRPLGVIHSMYRHDVRVRIEGDTILVTSIGAQEVLEVRALKTGALLSRKVDDVSGTATGEEPDILDLAKRKPLQVSVDGKPAKFGDPHLAKAIEALTDLPRPCTVPATIKIFEQESRVWLRKLKQREDEKNPQMWEGWEQEADRCGHFAILLASSRDPRAAVALCRTLDNPTFPGGIRVIEGLYNYFLFDARFHKLPAEQSGVYAGTSFYPEMIRQVKKWWALNKSDLGEKVVLNVIKPNFKPKNGYVPDAKAAIRIAVAVWEAIYGEEKIAGEKPYRARLTNGVWMNGT